MNKDIFECETEEDFIKSKCDINKVDQWGRNALFHSDLEKSKWLVKYGININLLDADSISILMNIPSNHIDKAQFLIDIGIDLKIFKNNPDKLNNMRSKPVKNLVLNYLNECIKL
ncbi:ankyrin repeat domain-containing protein [Yersinia intermedia]|uniref:ankyrin repeat domain-containing protein n=1 Tax=Yersinia intermedia TaxID=631 RepID=UPI0005ACADC8|nr:ankyrin repeat domain-containing protein [Yersinia intermedia]AJJ20939.1 hypothetical protein CH53_3493 [Yersinia intermedia]